MRLTSVLWLILVAFPQSGLAQPGSNAVKRVIDRARVAVGSRRTVKLTELERQRPAVVHEQTARGWAKKTVWLTHVEPQQGSALQAAIQTLRSAHGLQLRVMTDQGGFVPPDLATLRFPQAEAHYKGGVLTHYSLKMMTHNGSFPLQSTVTVLPDGKLQKPLFGNGNDSSRGIFGGPWSGVGEDVLRQAKALQEHPIEAR